MASESHRTTTDHGEIRTRVEEHEGAPARVKGVDSTVFELVSR